MSKTIKEEWKPIKGYEGQYEVSTLGRIKSLKRDVFRENRYGKGFVKHKEMILANNIVKSGYVMTTLHKNGKPKSFFIHRLVAETFILNPNAYKEINHIDKNRQNNNVNNLEWCTRTYNNTYSKAKKVKQYDLHGNFIKTWGSIKEAAKGTNSYRANISSCCRGKTKTTGGYIWKYAS